MLPLFTSVQWSNGLSLKGPSKSNTARETRLSAENGRGIEITGRERETKVAGTGRPLPTCGLKAIYRRNKLINYTNARRIRSDQSIKYPGTTADAFSDTHGSQYEIYQEKMDGPPQSSMINQTASRRMSYVFRQNLAEIFD